MYSPLAPAPYQAVFPENLLLLLQTNTVLRRRNIQPPLHYFVNSSIRLFTDHLTTDEVDKVEEREAKRAKNAVVASAPPTADHTPPAFLSRYQIYISHSHDPK